MILKTLSTKKRYEKIPIPIIFEKMYPPSLKGLNIKKVKGRKVAPIIKIVVSHCSEIKKSCRTSILFIN